VNVSPTTPRTPPIPILRGFIEDGSHGADG
jgi:hypothetical protein